MNNTGTITDIVYAPTGRRFAYYVNGSFAGFTIDLPGGLRAGGQTAGAGVQTYSHPDWLGSSRTLSSVGRTWVGSQAYAPFGETYAATGSVVSLFTNQYNDEAGDLYDFPAREQHRVQGRLISPDPAGLAAADPSTPQTWNRYAYVMGNPLSYIDPMGMACYPFEKKEYGTCAPFMNNGVNFGANWNEFDLFNIPVVTQTFTPPQPIYADISAIHNQYGEAVSATIIIPGAWTLITIGTGFDLFGGIVPWYYQTPGRRSLPGPIRNGIRNAPPQGTCHAQALMDNFGPGAQNFVNKFSLFSYVNSNAAQAWGTTLELGAVKFGALGLGYGVGGWLALDESPTVAAAGAILQEGAIGTAEFAAQGASIATGLATAMDAQASYQCSGVP